MQSVKKANAVDGVPATEFNGDQPIVCESISRLEAGASEIFDMPSCAKLHLDGFIAPPSARAVLKICCGKCEISTEYSRLKTPDYSFQGLPAWVGRVAAVGAIVAIGFSGLDAAGVAELERMPDWLLAIIVGIAFSLMATAVLIEPDVPLDVRRGAQPDR